MKDDNENKERVRAILRRAFADTPCPDNWKKANACGPLPHHVAVELRRSFYNYEPEEVHYMLPYLLEDMMDTRTCDDIDTADAEYLIMQLNPLNDDPVISAIKLAQFAPSRKSRHGRYVNG